jgi:hypothetical protein
MDPDPLLLTTFSHRDRAVAPSSLSALDIQLSTIHPQPHFLSIHLDARGPQLLQCADALGTVIHPVPVASLRSRECGATDREAIVADSKIVSDKRCWN